MALGESAVIYDLRFTITRNLQVNSPIVNRKCLFLAPDFFHVGDAGLGGFDGNLVAEFKTLMCSGFTNGLSAA